MSLSRSPVAILVLALMSCGGPLPRSDVMVMEEPVMAEPLAEIAPHPSPIVRNPRAKAGVLTAADIDDGRNLRAFSTYLKHARRGLNLPRADFREPVAFQLQGPDGVPAPGVRLTLRKPGAEMPFWSGYSGVDGRLVVYPRLHGAGGHRSVELRAFHADGQLMHNARLPRGGGVQQVHLPQNTDWTPDFLDLVFVVDTTGSMADELDWLTRDLLKIVTAAKRKAPGVNIRYGLILYRDVGDAYRVRNLGFTKSSRQMRRWLRAQSASGGGDYPEAAAEGLRAAASLNWRRGRGERLVFHIADAPPHAHQSRAYLDAAVQLARKDVQIFGLGASGVAAESEFLMRQASAMNNGRYLFLTDDSGIGYGHAEPTISCYRVTRLSNLVERVLASELSGRRVEARSKDVLREVGSYQSGACQN